MDTKEFKTRNGPTIVICCCICLKCILHQLLLDDGFPLSMLRVHLNTRTYQLIPNGMTTSSDMFINLYISTPPDSLLSPSLPLPSPLPVHDAWAYTSIRSEKRPAVRRTRRSSVIQPSGNCLRGSPSGPPADGSHLFDLSAAGIIPDETRPSRPPLRTTTMSANGRLKIHRCTERRHRYRLNVSIKSDVRMLPRSLTKWV